MERLINIIDRLIQNYKIRRFKHSLYINSVYKSEEDKKFIFIFLFKRYLGYYDNIKLDNCISIETL